MSFILTFILFLVSVVELEEDVQWQEERAERQAFAPGQLATRLFCFSHQGHSL